MFGNVAAGRVVALYLVFLLILVCNGLLTYEVLRGYDLRLCVRVWMSLAVLSSFANVFTPLRGGAGVRAAYLRGVYGFPLSSFVSALGAMYSIYVVVHGGIGLVAMAWFSSRGHAVPPVLGVFITLVTASAFALILVPLRTVKADVFPMRQVREIVQGWWVLRSNPGCILRLTLITCAVAALTGVQYWLAFGAYGVRLSPAELLLFVSARNLVVLIGITPGALGIAEALTVYMGQILDFSPPEALLVQTLIRVISFSTLAVASPVAGRALSIPRPSAQDDG